MKDFIEHLEDLYEAEIFRKTQPNGMLKCGCGKIFDPDEEGGFPSENPYCVPVCGDCFDNLIKSWKKNKNMAKKTCNGKLDVSL